MPEGLPQSPFFQGIIGKKVPIIIEETRTALSTKPGEIKKVDYEYRRNGAADFFMMFAPLAGQRHVEVCSSRKREDFAYCIQQLADVYYPDCEKTVLAMDNLNTHSIASLYETFVAATPLPVIRASLAYI